MGEGGGGGGLRAKGLWVVLSGNDTVRETKRVLSVRIFCVSDFVVVSLLPLVAVWSMSSLLEVYLPALFNAWYLLPSSYIT